MDKRIFYFQDTKLNSATAPLYELRVLASADGLALLAVTKGVETGALKRWNFSRKAQGHPHDILKDLQVVANQEELFAYPFGKVRWSWFNAQMTLVPRRFFNANSLDQYFKLLLHADTYIYGYKEWPEADCVAVHALPPQWPVLCTRYFPQAEQGHFGLDLLRYWRDQAQRNAYDVFLHVHHTQGQIAVFDRQNLLFYNAFSFAHANDMLYFVLLAYEQFKLNPAETPLTLSGHLLEGSEGWKQFYRYIRHLTFAPAPGLVILPQTEEAWPPHCHIDLLLN